MFLCPFTKMMLNVSISLKKSRKASRKKAWGMQFLVSKRCSSSKTMRNTWYLQSWIIHIYFILHAIFYHNTKIKDYNIRVLKTILWIKTLKSYSDFFWIIWFEPRRRRWNSLPPCLNKVFDRVWNFSLSNYL